MPASVELFKRYPNPALVETGTYLGEGVRHALAAGFQSIRSVELAETLFADNLRRFTGNPRVRLFQGTSDDQTLEHDPRPLRPATFWLDAHYSAGITAKGPENCPILKELRIIARHPIKTHTLLFDDRRLLGTVDFDFLTEDHLRTAISALNPAYQFSHDTGSHEQPIFLNDILVARVP